MSKVRILHRVLAAAVSSACAATVAPVHAWTISLPDTCTAAQSNGNFVINCAGQPTPTPTPTPSPTPSPSPSPSPSPVPTGGCSAYSATHVIDVPWMSGTRLITQSFGGFGSNEITVYRITVPATATVGQYWNLAGAEWGDPPTTRTAALSANACDLSAPLSAMASYMESNSVNFYFRVGSGDGYYPGVQPGQTVYLNVVNWASSFGSTCSPGAQCNMFMDIYKR